MAQKQKLVRFSAWVTPNQSRFLNKKKGEGSEKVREALKEKYGVE
jgi:hypothetical protein